MVLWDYPVFWTWSTNNPFRLFFIYFLKIRGGGSFRFFLILAPSGGSNPEGLYQTSFLTMQGILHWSPTLLAPFLALLGKKTLSTRDFNVS